MKIVLGVGCAAVLMAAGFDAKTDVTNAAKKLAEAANYSWTSTPKFEGGGGQGARFQPGPTEGKAEKDGFTVLTAKQGETSTEAVLKGEKGAVKTADGWKAASEFQGQQGGQQGRRDPAGGLARRLRTFKAPAVEAQALVEKAQELKDDGDGAYSSALTETGAKELLSTGRGQGGQAPQVTEPKGTVKFWVKEGTLVKYEVNVQGKMTIREQEVAVNRTTTVEIKDVGTTKVEVAEDAKKKLE